LGLELNLKLRFPYQALQELSVLSVFCNFSWLSR